MYTQPKARKADGSYDFDKMDACTLLPVSKGVWSTKDRLITIKFDGKAMSISTSKVTDYRISWDARPGFEHWNTEISFGGDDQWMLFVFVRGANLVMYWENSY